MSTLLHATVSVVVTSCCLFVGCLSQPKTIFCLRDETTGFIQGPFAVGDAIESSRNTVKIVIPSDIELATLEKLRSTVFKFEPFTNGFEAAISDLNDVLNESKGNKICIKVDFPSSWDLPEYSSKELKQWGYSEGFGGSRKNNLPKVIFNTAGSLSVYNMLHALIVVWPIPFRFTIDGETVVLKVADYRNNLTEYYPPHSESMTEKSPLCPNNQTGMGAVEFP